MNHYLIAGVAPDSQPFWMMLLSTQCGVADRQQALGVGFSERQLERRVKAGKWQRIYPGVYATFTGPLPREARLWAALRWAGEGALLSSQPGPGRRQNPPLWASRSHRARLRLRRPSRLDPAEQRLARQPALMPARWMLRRPPSADIVGHCPPQRVGYDPFSVSGQPSMGSAPSGAAALVVAGAGVAAVVSGSSPERRRGIEARPPAMNSRPAIEKSVS